VRLLILSPLFLVLPLAAQATHLVGPGQTHADINAAIAAAAPGDRILVSAGTYPQFTVDKGVAIRAEPVGAQVTIQGPGLGAVLCFVPPGQHAHLEGLTLQHETQVARHAGYSTVGVVSFTDISAQRGLVINSAAVVLLKCDFTSLYHGIEMLGSSKLTATDCALTGGTLNSFAAISPNGIRAGGSSKLLLSGCTLTGGSVVSLHSVNGIGAGLGLTGSAKAWLADCTVAADSYPFTFPATAGLINQSILPVALERTTTIDSHGQSPSVVGGSSTSGVVLGVSTPQPLVRGGTYQLDYRTRSGMFVVVHARFGIAEPMSQPFAVQPDWGFAAASVPLTVLVAGATGQVGTTLSIPNVAWAQDLGLWFEAWTGPPVPVQFSPVVGGLIR